MNLPYKDNPDTDPSLAPQWPEPRWGASEIFLVYICVMGMITAFEYWGQGFYQWAAPLVAGGNYALGHFYWAALLQYFSTILLVGLTVSWAGRGTWPELGLKAVSLKKLLVYGGGGGIALLIIVLLFSYLLQWINPAIEAQPFASMLEQAAGFWELTYIAVIGAVIGPLAEEIYFRGMIYPVVRSHFGVQGGIIGCGLLFGLSHFDPWRAVPLAVGGMILAYIYEKTGSVFACALAHGIWNGAVTALFVNNLL